MNRKTLHLGALLLLVGCSTTGGMHLNSGAIFGEKGPAPSPTDFGESPLVMPPIPPKTASDSAPSDSDAAPAASSAPATTASATTAVAKASPPAAKTAPKAAAKAAATTVAATTPAATPPAKPSPPTKLAVSNVKPAPGVTAPQGDTSDSDGAAPSGDSKDGWSTLSPKTGGGFHVDMPNARVEKDDTVDVGDKSAKLHAWFAKASDGSVYTASVIQMAGATDSTLHDVGEGLASGCGGTVTTEAPAHLGATTGIRVVIQCKDKSSFVARLYRAHGAIFEIGVMRKAGTEPTAASAEELGRFFDSFALV